MTGRRREAKLPYGDVLREVRTVPRLGVTVSPTNAVVPLAAATKRIELQVEVVHNAEAASTGTVSLTLPAGWKAEPVSHPLAFARAGERASFRFTVTPSTLDAKPYAVEAVATVEGRSYREGYELIDQRDLELRYLYRPSTVEVRGIDVTVLPNLKVGYVMGVGDQVPLGLQTGLLDAVPTTPLLMLSMQLFGQLKYMQDMPVAPFMGAVVLSEAACGERPSRSSKQRKHRTKHGQHSDCGLCRKSSFRHGRGQRYWPRNCHRVRQGWRRSDRRRHQWRRPQRDGSRDQGIWRQGHFGNL
jgi:hypothetical protein